MNYVIAQGDCLEVMRGMEDSSVDAVVTDPPYGMDYQSQWRKDKSTWKEKISGDTQPFIWFLRDAARVLRPKGFLVCFHEWRFADAFRQAIVWAGLSVKSQGVWDREIHGMGDLLGALAPRHDLFWLAAKGRAIFPGSRPKSVFRCARVSAEELEHPTEKPISLMRDIVRAVTPPGGLVLDPFAGSGSTGVACMMEGFRFVGIELNPEYCEIARKRIETAKGPR